MEKNSEKNKKYELVAPDGGWGYMICLAFVINLSTTLSFMGCFGLLYNDFIEEIKMSSASVTLLTGIISMSMALGGFFTPSLLKLMSLRKLCFVAIIMYDLGALGMVFANSVPVFFLCQGILMGNGLGISYNLSCSILNDYFVKRRMFAYSLTNFFAGATGIAAPMFVKWSLQEYGYRGTVLLVAGLMFHNIFAVSLMQPVKMHMKRVEVLPGADIQPLLVDEKINSIKLIDEEIGEIKVNEAIDYKENKLAIWRILSTFVDIPFAKKFIITCSCIGPSLCCFADTTFVAIMPQALYALNWSQDQVALSLSIFGAGDLVARTILIFSEKLIYMIGIQEFYVIGILLAGISRLGVLWSENYIAVYFYIALMGVGRCCLVTLVAMVFSEIVPSDKFSQAMGIAMMMNGVTSIILGPATGAIRDLTKSYNSTFYLLTSTFGITALFWTIELCYKKNKQKRILQKQTLEKIKSAQLNKGK